MPLAYITGASSGIGQALARRYGQAGWQLALVARRVDAVTAWVEQAGLDRAQVLVLPADVSRHDDIVAAGQRCLAERGTPDVVIASAGISVGVDTACREDLEVMAETLAVNVSGTAATFHPFIAAMRARRHGCLVGLASMAAVRGLPGHGAYCASKAAVVSYCESLRVELRQDGVRVVTLVPGFVDTPMTRGNPYPMPFRLSADEFAVRAMRAIAAGRRRPTIPWQMAMMGAAMRCLPGALYDRVVQGRGRKPRRSAGGSPIN